MTAQPPMKPALPPAEVIPMCRAHHGSSLLPLFYKHSETFASPQSSSASRRRGAVVFPTVPSEPRCLHSAMESIPASLYSFPSKGVGKGVLILICLPVYMPGLESPGFCEKVSLTHDFFPTSLLLSKHIAL